MLPCPWGQAGDGTRCAHPAAGQDRALQASPPLVPGRGGCVPALRSSGSLDIYSIARSEREEVDDNMFPVLCFVQISSRQHVCVCGGLSGLLSAASKQGSSKFSKAYSPPSNTALTLETVHGFDTPVGFLPTSLCQRFLGVSGRLRLAFAEQKWNQSHRTLGLGCPPTRAPSWTQAGAAVLPHEHHPLPRVALGAGGSWGQQTQRV